MTLIAIGGAEDKDGNMAVLKTVLARSRRKNPRVHVITTATGYPGDARETYRAAFARLGIKPDISHITSAQQADTPEMLARIQKADVVFFTGGDQSRLANVFLGTRFLQTLRKRHQAGAVIAGTSAGAAVMAGRMITGGRPENAHIRGAITSDAGFALTPGLIIDTHFHNRGRLHRLFNLLAEHPGKTGLGLDEDSAAIIHDDGRVEAIGSGGVTVIDAVDASAALTHRQTRAPEILTARPFNVTILRDGQQIRLKKAGRQPARKVV